MAITKSKLQRIEKRLIKQQKPEEKSDLNIPKDWAEFCRLTTIKSGNKMVQFNPYPYQQELINLMDKYPTVIVVKSRQLGITQAVLSRFLHLSLLNQAFTSVAFFKNNEDRGSNSERVRQMALSINAKYAIDNVGHQKFLGKGEIYLKNSSAEGSRGYDSVSGFLFDESAFMRNIESIYSASSASSAMLGDEVSKVILSTPSSKTGWYWEQLNKDNKEDIEETIKAVVNGDLPPFYYWVCGNTCKMIIWWKAHPIYSQKEDYLEYRYKVDGCSWEKIFREYNLSFINTEESIFSSDIIRLNATGEVESEPDPKGRYYLGVDPAYGGSNYCVAWILRKVKDKYYSVKWYRARRKTKDYNISKIQDLIEEFNPIGIGVETNSGGAIYQEDLTKMNPSREIQGIFTSDKNKIVMIDRLVLALEREQFIFPKDSPIYEEFLQFVRQGNKLGAAENAYDDCVMAAAIALTVAQSDNDSWSLSNIPKRRRNEIDEDLSSN